MSQLALFGTDRQSLIDDASGQILYFPACISVELARSWFDLLHEGIAWKHERRMMYEREVDVPRLVAGFRLDDRALPKPLAQAATLVERVAGARFNSVGLNCYRDRNDSVAPHHDRLGEIVAGHPIALLSLGATRRMTIRAKATPRRSLAIDLEAGSVLLMDYTSQLHYLHDIPKQKTAVGPRISVAFRMRPAPTFEVKRRSSIPMEHRCGGDCDQVPPAPTTTDRIKRCSTRLVARRSQWEDRGQGST
ncbi:MAG: alpha-ketoglutarate-dependent dioxygenase AlkB [Rhodanobacteraceae bacterium]